MIDKEKLTFFLGLDESFLNKFYELFLKYRGVCKYSVGLPNKQVRDD